jgi:hypothetical protein
MTYELCISRLKQMITAVAIPGSDMVRPKDAKKPAKARFVLDAMSSDISTACIIFSLNRRMLFKKSVSEKKFDLVDKLPFNSQSKRINHCCSNKSSW